MRNILITGSTDGIGRQTVVDLALLGHSVIIHGRTDEKCLTAAENIRELSNNPNVKFVSGDFSSLSQVRQLADKIKIQFNKIDVLINNAGIYKNEKVLTEDGFETTFAVNHLAPYLLTNLLYNHINDGGRIINVSSLAHFRAVLDWNNLNAEKYFDHYRAYALSKLANIFFTYYLAEKLENITVNALHPGVINTKLLKIGFNITGASLKEGSKTSIFLAVSDEVEGITGKYFSNSQLTSSSDLSYDKEAMNKMWNISAEMVKLNKISF